MDNDIFGENSKNSGSTLLLLLSGGVGGGAGSTGSVNDMIEKTNYMQELSEELQKQGGFDQVWHSRGKQYLLNLLGNGYLLCIDYIILIITSLCYTYIYLYVCYYIGSRFFVSDVLWGFKYY